MAGSINKVILIGNVGGQPEIRSTQNTGEELAFFSIATSEKWKDKNTGEQKEKTDWHKIVVFSPGLVKITKEYIHRGSKLYLEGKIQTREYESTDGIKKYTTEIILTQYNSTLLLLDSKKEAPESNHQESATYIKTNVSEEIKDDSYDTNTIPF